MPMFVGEFILSFELITLALGVSLIIWGLRNQGQGVMLARCTGYVVSLLALGLIALSLCTAIKMSKMRYHAKAWGMSMHSQTQSNAKDSMEPRGM